jgi:hypothetical protein
MPRVILGIEAGFRHPPLHHPGDRLAGHRFGEHLVAGVRNPAEQVAFGDPGAGGPFLEPGHRLQAPSVRDGDDGAVAFLVGLAGTNGRGFPYAFCDET